MDQISGPLALTGPYTQTEAARLLECSERSIQRLVETGKLRTVRAKGRWMVPASEIARLASSSPPAPQQPSAPVDTPAWLHDHLPSAERWWRLWLADREALRLAREACDTLPASRGDRLLTEHEASERTASLYYLSELMAASDHAASALDAHDVRPAIVERVKARKARISELISEVLAATEPKAAKVEEPKS
jgi:excisionase family DNA binding protein